MKQRIDGRIISIKIKRRDEMKVQFLYRKNRNNEFQYEDFIRQTEPSIMAQKELVNYLVDNQVEKIILNTLFENCDDPRIREWDNIAIEFWIKDNAISILNVGNYEFKAKLH